MTCVTHHNACDCREAKFAEMEAEVKRLRIDLEATSKLCYQLEAERDRLKAMIRDGITVYATLGGFNHALENEVWLRTRNERMNHKAKLVAITEVDREFEI